MQWKNYCPRVRNISKAGGDKLLEFSILIGSAKPFATSSRFQDSFLRSQRNSEKVASIPEKRTLLGPTVISEVSHITTKKKSSTKPRTITKQQQQMNWNFCYTIALILAASFRESHGFLALSSAIMGQEFFPTTDAPPANSPSSYSFLTITSALEWTDTVQDLNDLTFDWQTFSQAPTLLLDHPANQLLLANHLADPLVDGLNRIFSTSISVKAAQIAVRILSLGSIYSVCDNHSCCWMPSHPEQLLLQGALLMTAINDFCKPPTTTR